ARPRTGPPSRSAAPCARCGRAARTPRATPRASAESSRASLLDRHADGVAPLGPAAVVVAHAGVAEQVREHEPRVAAALADPTVGHHVVRRLELLLGLVDRA